MLSFQILRKKKETNYIGFFLFMDLQLINIVLIQASR
ncbi:hypothetical protein MCETHM1_00065 [Flavobacteriaceae bacterium]